MSYRKPDLALSEYISNSKILKYGLEQDKAQLPGQMTRRSKPKSTKITTPLVKGYHPEIDDSAFLEDKGHITAV